MNNIVFKSTQASPGGARLSSLGVHIFAGKQGDATALAPHRRVIHIPCDMPLVGRPMSCMPGYFEVINPHTVGSQTIHRASIKWL